MSSKLKQLSLSVAFALANTAAVGTANAHGWAEFPSARQNTCYNDGGFWSNAIPNAACEASYDKSGVEAFIQRNEVASMNPNYNDINTVKANIKDGQLCAAGMLSKMGLDIPHKDRQKLRLYLIQMVNLISYGQQRQRITHLFGSFTSRNPATIFHNL